MNFDKIRQIIRSGGTQSKMLDAVHHEETRSHMYQMMAQQVRDSIPQPPDYENLYREKVKEADKLRIALCNASHKLVLYRKNHDGNYIGGMEYSQLMEQIEDALGGKGK